jgi:hypothetical protein
MKGFVMTTGEWVLAALATAHLIVAIIALHWRR